MLSSCTQKRAAWCPLEWTQPISVPSRVLWTCHMTPSKLFSRLPNIDLRTLHADTLHISGHLGQVWRCSFLRLQCDWYTVGCPHTCEEVCGTLLPLPWWSSETRRSGQKNLTFRCSCKQTTVRYACVHLIFLSPFRILCASSQALLSHAHAQYANYSADQGFVHMLSPSLPPSCFKDLPDMMPKFLRSRSIPEATRWPSFPPALLSPPYTTRESCGVVYASSSTTKGLVSW
jgi:hypothetical protein